MAIQLNDKQRALFDGKNFAYLATIGPDGKPQVTPVWVEYDGRHIIVNSEQKRAKVRNVKTNPSVSVAIADASNPYQYVEVRGKVVEVTAEGGAEGIDRLAKKYIDKDKYPWNQPGDVRVVIKIAPEKVLGMG
jgi:PPOX class probable F420-dependent enzyme